MSFLKKKISVLTLLVIAAIAGAAYFYLALQPGGTLWCKTMKTKPKTEWSIEGAVVYAENCVFKD